MLLTVTLMLLISTGVWVWERFLVRVTYLSDQPLLAICAGPASGPERTTDVQILEGTNWSTVQLTSFSVGTLIKISENRFFLESWQYESIRLQEEHVRVHLGQLWLKGWGIPQVRVKHQITMVDTVKSPWCWSWPTFAWTDEAWEREKTDEKEVHDLHWTSF